MERSLTYFIGPRNLVEAVDVYTSFAVEYRKRMIDLKDKLIEKVNDNLHCMQTFLWLL